MSTIKMKNIFSGVAAVLLLFVVSTTAFAQAQWTTVLDATPASMTSQLVSSSEESIKVRLQVPGFYSTTVSTPQGDAQVITVPHAVSTAQAGEPDVPMIGIPAIIGNQARMEVRVVDAKYIDFDNFMVAPSKGDFPRTIDPASVPYTYGPCYSVDAFFPTDNAELHDPYILRDYRGQNIALHPFVYNPVTKTLRVYYDLTVEMYKVDNNGQNTLQPHRSNEVKTDPNFKQVYGRHFINYQASQSKYTPVDEEGDLLIICHDSFMSAMEPFVNWKKTRGVNTTIVGTSTAGTTSSAIKTYIKNQYSANNNLTHVLLVGDVAQIPGYSYSGGGSNYKGLGDNPYGQVVGNDIFNDIFIGRFSAQTIAQVTNQVNKVITYERDLTTADTWCQNGLGISTTEGNGGHYNEDDYRHIENLRTDLLNFGYNTVYQDYKSVSGYPSSTTTTISNHINSGVGIINYCNHGSQTAWQSHNYTNNHVNALTNDNKLPFIFSVACLVGKYDHPSDCFAEAWMRATNNSTDAPTGAIGGMFSYISQPWVPPMWAQDEFVDILTEQYSNNIKHTLGGAAINGIMGILDHYSTSDAAAVGTYQAWVLYGDPSMMLRTKTPQAMTVTHEGSILPGMNTYTVTVSNGDGALATITDASHNILGKAIVSNGTANISINGTLIPDTQLSLCVFGYNKVTTISPIEVIAPEGPYITLDSYTPAVTYVGENTALSLTFKNVGLEATNGTTTVTLTADSPDDVTIISGTATLDALEPEATATVSDFQFRLNPDIDLDSKAQLHYAATNGDNTWEGNIVITPNQKFTVTVASSNDDFGTVSGGGQFDYKESCTVTATPVDGYMLTNWTQNGAIVSTDAEYTFNVTDDTDLVANFSLGTMIGNGTATNENLPGYTYYKYSLSEQIYTSDELGGSGIITSIAFYNDGAQKTRNYDIYLKATTKDKFNSVSDWIAVTADDKVFSGRVTMVSGDWTTITFTSPFFYDGTSNVVLVTDDNTGNYSGTAQMSCRVFNAASQAIYIYNDNTNYNPSSPSGSGTKLNEKNQLIVVKETPADSYNITVTASPALGGTVSGAVKYGFGETCTLMATANPGYYFTGWTENGEVISTQPEYSFCVLKDRTLTATFAEGYMAGDGGETTNEHLPTMYNRNYSLTQQIYAPDEIGTAGTINAIAFYNVGAGKKRILDMYLMHTTKSEFTDKTDWITAETSDKVFSGEVTMVKNDWTFITLDTPFEYDGTSNLAVIVDDNTGAAASSKMAYRVYTTTSNQALYAHSKDNLDPTAPPTETIGTTTTNNVWNQKNQLFFNISSTSPAMLTLANDGITNEAAIDAAAASGNTFNVKLAGRTLYKDGEWNTICLPFCVTLEGSPLADATAKTLTDASMDGNTVSLTFGSPVDNLQAGVPYLIRWEDGENIVDPVFPGVTVVSTTEADRTIEKADGQVNFIGYYDAFPITADDTEIYYMTTGNKLKHTGVNRTLMSCRAYFRFTDGADPAKFLINFGDGDATGIVDHNRETITNNRWYTVDGKTLDQQPTVKGMYIHNGRVVVIK